MNNISIHCRIVNNQVWLNHKKIFAATELSSDQFLFDLYKHLSINYPKFHKMDVLSKTGLLCTEMLCKHYPKIKFYADDEIAVLVANNHASSEVDNKFYHSYTAQKAPSPSLFVYTLPNIVIGEIAIRNKWYGESMFIVIPEFNAEQMALHANLLLEGKTKACLCGWLNVEDGIDAFLFFAEKSNDSPELINLNGPEITKLYTAKHG
jgi:hypothetical protein